MFRGETILNMRCIWYFSYSRVLRFCSGSACSNSSRCVNPDLLSLGEQTGKKCGIIWELFPNSPAPFGNLGSKYGNFRVILRWFEQKFWDSQMIPYFFLEGSPYRLQKAWLEISISNSRKQVIQNTLLETVHKSLVISWPCMSIWNVPGNILWPSFPQMRDWQNQRQFRCQCFIA